MEKCSNYNQWIADTIKPFVKGKVCEFGCGTGSVAKYFFNKNYCGIDIDKKHIKRCQKLFGITENFKCVDATHCWTPAIFKHKFDTILMVNFLEHIYSPVALIDNVQQMLKNSGKVVIIVPAHEWNYGIVDEADGHACRYSKRGVTNLLKDKFKITTIREQNFFGALGWYYNGKLVPSKMHRSNELGVYDKLVPLFRWYEEKFWIPFGLSLVVVAEKK
jgi:SAM-dependent methyltransferase